MATTDERIEELDNRVKEAEDALLAIGDLFQAMKKDGTLDYDTKYNLSVADEKIRPIHFRRLSS